jgi:hypothetical protein
MNSEPNNYLRQESPQWMRDMFEELRDMFEELLPAYGRCAPVFLCSLDPARAELT